MKMESLKDDDFITSWLAAESVNYLKTKDNFNRKETRTKLHKIIYLVADNHNIPITRGWYKHGPFIYNNNVLNVDYSKNLLKWTSKSFKVESYYKNIKKYDLDIEEIKNTIYKVVDLISKHSADECMYLLYKKYTPIKFRELYLNKYNLTGIRTNINSIINYFKSKFNIDRSHEPSFYMDGLLNDIDKFELEANSIFDDNRIEPYTDRFFNIFREVVWKSEILYDNNGLDDNIIKSLIFSQNCFESSIWSPYSGNIIKETAKGIGEHNAQEMGRRTRRNALKNAARNISRYNNLRLDNDMELTYDDMKNHKRNKKYSELDKKLLELVKLTSEG